MERENGWAWREKARAKGGARIQEEEEVKEEKKKREMFCIGWTRGKKTLCWWRR